MTTKLGKRLASVDINPDVKHFLTRIAQDMEHDANCWKSINERSDASNYIRAFAYDREQCIRFDVDVIYEAIRVAALVEEESED